MFRERDEKKSQPFTKVRLILRGMKLVGKSPFFPFVSSIVYPIRIAIHISVFYRALPIAHVRRGRKNGVLKKGKQERGMLFESCVRRRWRMKTLSILEVVVYDERLRALDLASIQFRYEYASVATVSGRLNGWLVGWLVGGLVGWLVSWSVGRVFDYNRREEIPSFCAAYTGGVLSHGMERYQREIREISQVYKWLIKQRLLPLPSAFSYPAHSHSARLFPTENIRQRGNSKRSLELCIIGERIYSNICCLYLL